MIASKIDLGSSEWANEQGHERAESNRAEELEPVERLRASVAQLLGARVVVGGSWLVGLIGRSECCTASHV